VSQKTAFRSDAMSAGMTGLDRQALHVGSNFTQRLTSVRKPPPKPVHAENGPPGTLSKG
jgi:hypothetical protein